MKFKTMIKALLILLSTAEANTSGEARYSSQIELELSQQNQKKAFVTYVRASFIDSHTPTQYSLKINDDNVLYQFYPLKKRQDGTADGIFIPNNIFPTIFMQFTLMSVGNTSEEKELLNELNDNWDAYLTENRDDSAQSFPLFGSIQQKKNPKVSIFFGIGKMIAFPKSNLELGLKGSVETD